MSSTDRDHLMASNIDRIAAYTAADAQLSAAHHFLYDVRHRLTSDRPYVVMGINPGETELDWKITDGPTQETSSFDFHDGRPRSRSSTRWFEQIDFYLGGEGCVLTELFFWSSRDLGHFRERFGALAESARLGFCVEMNKSLIDAHQGRAVVFPGISVSGLTGRLYGLTRLQPLVVDRQRLVEHWTDGHRPWLFTKHWTGARGFSRDQKCAVREYIASHT